MPQRDELVVPLAIGKIEASQPSAPSPSAMSRARFKFSASGAQLALRRRAIESADAHVDRMDLPPAQQLDRFRCRPSSARGPALDHVAMVLRHLDRAGIAEEIGRMQHVDVQRVALDPLAAVEQPAQLPQLARSTVTPSASSIACTALIW